MRARLVELRRAWEREAERASLLAPCGIGPLDAAALAVERLPAPGLAEAIVGVTSDQPALLASLIETAERQVQIGGLPAALEVVRTLGGRHGELEADSDWEIALQSQLSGLAWSRGPLTLVEGAEPRLVLLRVGPPDNPADFPDQPGLVEVTGLPADRLALLRIESGLIPSDLQVYQLNRAAFTSERQRRHFGLLGPPSGEPPDGLQPPAPAGAGRPLTQELLRRPPKQVANGSSL